jgi:hypothetical protein
MRREEVPKKLEMEEKKRPFYLFLLSDKATSSNA